MASWQDVKQFLYSNYKINSDEDGVLSILFETGNNRSQLVFVAQTGDFLRLLSPVADEGSASPARVLGEPSLFGVTKFGSHFCLVHNQLLDTVDEAEITGVIPLLAGFADKLESALTGSDSY